MSQLLHPDARGIRGIPVHCTLYCLYTLLALVALVRVSACVRGNKLTL